jgi:hypothetical protein
MNQRSGKTYRAAMGNDGRVDLRELVSFMERCAGLLNHNGHHDPAFYFEQVADHLRNSPQKGLSEDAGRILGL